MPFYTNTIEQERAWPLVQKPGPESKLAVNTTSTRTYPGLNYVVGFFKPVQGSFRQMIKRLSNAQKSRQAREINFRNIQTMLGLHFLNPLEPEARKFHFRSISTTDLEK